MKLEDLIRNTFSLGADVVITDMDGPQQLDGWDSLGHVNLISSIETTYQVSLNVDEILSIERIADIKTILARKGISEV